MPKRILWSFLMALLFAAPSTAEISTSDPLWDWKYDAIDRLSLAFGEGTVSNTRPVSRLEMASMVIRVSPKANELRDDDYLKVIIKRLEEDLKDEIKGINEGTIGDLKIKPLRWVRIKAAHAEDPLQMANDYGFKAGKPSIRGEASTSGTWGPFGYEVRPEYFVYRDDDGSEDDDEFDLHSGYLVAWMKNVEIEVGKDSFWWGPGYRGNWVLTNNAPAFELIKISNAVTAEPPFPLGFMGDTKLVAFLGRLSEQTISYIYHGETVSERKKPFLAGFRLDFSPSKYLELGAAQTILFIDRGGRGYTKSYLSQTFVPTYDGNENEVTDGPVADRIQAIDVSLKIDGAHDFMKVLRLKGIKAYWSWGGETMVTDETTGLPTFGVPGNLYGVYIDAGRTEFRAEYATNFNSSGCGVTWYDHYQFIDGYTNDGFVLGHPEVVGKRKNTFVSISQAVMDNLIATVHFEGKETNNDSVGNVKENDYGLSVVAFGKKGDNLGISYEYRKNDDPQNVNQIWIIEAVKRFD